MDVMFPPGVFFSSAGLWRCKKLAEMQRSICIMVSLALIQPKAFHTAFPLLICFLRSVRITERKVTQSKLKLGAGACLRLELG